MTEVSGPSRKGPAAFRTISEASVELGVPQHVLRFWETKFAFIRPMKRAGGRRFYRPQDLDVLRGVRLLLQEEGYTIKGVQKLHKEQGLKRLVAASGIGEAEAAQVAAQVEADAAEAEASPPAPAADAGAAAEAAAAMTDGTSDGVAEDVPSDEPPPWDADARPPRPGAPLLRPALEAGARRRLAEVLGDLETTKAAIDALLQES